MKTMYKFFFALCLIFATHGVFAKNTTEEYYREVRKSFPVNANVVLNFDVNFGHVTATSWDQNHMEILVKINVDVKSEKRAEQIFQGVQITESATNPSVRVNPGNSKGNNESYDIYVEVKMPKTTTFTGDINFGNLSVNSMSGPVNMRIEYGNVTITEALSNDNDIDVAFGNIIIDVCGGGVINEQYGNVRVKNAKGSMEIDTDFGNVEVRGFTKECKRIEIDCDYGNIEVNTKGLGYKLKAKVEYGDLDVEGSSIKVHKDELGLSKSANGSTGDANTELDLECNFGSIELE
jgi:Putative adhesin